jgi:hypothetical protein
MHLICAIDNVQLHKYTSGPPRSNDFDLAKYLFALKLRSRTARIHKQKLWIRNIAWLLLVIFLTFFSYLGTGTLLRYKLTYCIGTIYIASL